jgi:hypothetical protein
MMGKIREFRLALVILFMVVLVTSIVFIVSALTSTQIFYDNLETNNFATVWTNDVGNKFTRSGGVVYQGSFAILTDGGSTNALLTLTNGLNITNQTSCNITSVTRISANLDGGEYLCMDYSTDGGATWNLNTGSDGALGGLCQDGNIDTENSWRNTSISSLSGSSIKARFRISTNNVNEDGYIDNVNITCLANSAATVSNITALPNPIGGSATITIYANTSSHGVNDTEADTLNFYCDDSTLPTALNTECTGGATTDTTYPYSLDCSFTSQSGNGNYTKYCRIYDGHSYSSIMQANYTVNADTLVTSLVSVAGDASASYFDISNDGLTEIIVSGESGMSCRWSPSDLAYNAMSTACSISGIQANCSINDVASQGFVTRYVSCQNLLGTGQTNSNNLDISFYLDYTAPTTTDDSVSILKTPNYVVTITETDNVDSDSTSYYCTSASQGCTPTTSIDNGGLVTYTSSNRGANYLRYYSTDDAGNTQVVVNKTININRLSIFTSANDDATTVKGGTTINVSTLSYDSDSGQEMTLYVCSSSGATAEGCTGGHHCNITGGANLSCTFTSETDSTSHTWYSYLFDDSNESASANPLTGIYTTDSTAPIITTSSPSNGSTITQNSITFTIVVNEALSWAVYSINEESNISLSNVSVFEWTSSNLSIADGVYNLSFYVNDSYGNPASLLGYTFTIDSTAGDTTSPIITIISPINNTYYTNESILLNITTDESLGWAGFTNNSNILRNLGNVSTINWNATIILAEGQHNITFYANDSSSNKNQNNKSIGIYVDLANPQVTSFTCGDVNDSVNVNCSYSVTDSFGLSHLIISYNATGNWQNSSSISISGTSATGSYIINAANTTMPGFSAQLSVYDLSLRVNDTKTDNILVSDDTFPTIWNITYIPNSTGLLDPGVNISVEVNITEDYSIADVYLMYKNSTASDWNFVNMTNMTTRAINVTIAYNTSFSPENGSWEFKINATDSQGNQNLSSIIQINVTTENSFFNYTSITDVKSFSYAQRIANNTLGTLYINNTGDNNLNFTVEINASSALVGKFDINYTSDNNASYELIPGAAINLSILTNTTSLVSGLYDYNVSVMSAAGDTLLMKKLNIQTSEEAYLQISIDTYSSSVTTSQTGITYVVSVSNLGTQDATDVYLNWTLPSIFTLVSGNLSRSLGTLPIGSSGTNTITVNVGSATTDVTYYVNATATAGNADSVNTSKAITVSNPVTITQTSSSTSGGGGGGSSAGGSVGSVVYSKSIEMVRGEKDMFNIEIYNKNYNSSLEGLTVNLTGFLDKYFEIVPSKIISIGSRQSANFTVTLKIPEYKEYEEHTLVAVITGFKVDSGVSTTYSETQNIKLVVQEVSRENASKLIEEANKVIEEMKSNGFNVDRVMNLIISADAKLSDRKNKAAWLLAQEVISIGDKAFESSDLISRITQALENPKLTGLITGNVVSEIVDENNNTISTNSLITGNAIFGSKSAEEVLALAKAAFQRGDYDTALERAKSAQVLLLLERKGNFGFFLYLYWHYVLLGLIAALVLGMWATRQYKQIIITRRINESDKEEDNIRQLMQTLQANYFSGKINSQDYHRTMSQYQDNVAKIRKSRTGLRNIRLKTISSEQITKDLKNERAQTEQQIKNLQAKFYVDKKISEGEYKTQMEMLNGMLAEIEDEETTSLVLEKQGGNEKIFEFKGKNGATKETDVNKKNKFNLFGWPFNFVKKLWENRKMKQEKYIRDKIKIMGIK